MKTILLMIICCVLNAQFDLKKSVIYEEKRAKIMTLGLFHFAYPSLDSHKTVEEERIDVLSKKRQTEIKELIAKLKIFKPTKIFIEWGHKGKHLWIQHIMHI